TLQSGLIFQRLKEPEAAHYQQKILFRLKQPFDLTNFKYAWKHTLQQYDILRSHVTFELDSRPLLSVQKQCGLIWDVENVNPNLSTADDIIQSWMADNSTLPLDSAPLMRMRWCAVEGDILWLWRHDHVLMDGWSLPIVLTMVFESYAALQGQGALPVSAGYRFSDYSQWLAHQDVAEAEAFWRQTFSAVDQVALLSDSRGSLQGLPVEVHSTLGSDESTALSELAKSWQVTPNIVLQLCLGVTLKQVLQTDTIVYGITDSGRPDSMPDVGSRVGLFIQSIPWVQTIDDTASCQTWAQDIQQWMQSAQQHGHIGLADIQKQAPQLASLFDVLFVYENYPIGPSLELPGIEISDVIAGESTHYPLTVTAQLTHQLQLKWRSGGELTEDFLRRIAARFEWHLTQLLAEPDQSVMNECCLMPDEVAARKEVQTELSKTAPHAKTVTECYREQVSKTPDAVAVLAQGVTLSYQGFDHRVQQLAHFMRQKGVVANSRIGICLPRSVDYLVSLYAALSSSCSYVPLDSQLPSARLKSMCAIAKVTHVLTLSEFSAYFSECACIYLDQDDSTIQASPSDVMPLTVQPDDELYVIFTSGTTGQPKGTSITHRSEFHLLQWYQQCFAMNADDRHLVISSPGFDLTQKNLLVPLLSGGSVVIPSMPYYDDVEILHCLSRSKATRLNCAPSMFYPLLASKDYTALSSLKTVFLGGEPIHLKHLSEWLASQECQCEVVNTYGPTECTDIATYYRLQQADFTEHSVPIGRAIPWVHTLVLNDAHKMVPFETEGELYIGGVGVSQGYVGQPEQTADKFIVIDGYKGRFYKTGDRVSLTQTGELRFLGRSDDQVKIRGLRIELAEIEGQIERCDNVTSAIVLCEQTEQGESVLLAFIVTTRGLASDDLQAALLQALPHYMVPSEFILVESIPLTLNGKVDKRQLLSFRVHRDTPSTEQSSLTVE
ncbi:MAG: amino acid adenylation domain-containing protein, partial [Methylococcales bacterium]|nr:amino acid adenylation domain-containing protein [Methylococcales bacterium]